MSLIDKITELCTERQIKTPALIFDKDRIVASVRQFQSSFQWARLFYAMKVNPHPALLSIFSELGLSFDVASDYEIKALQSLGVDGNRMILANPVKTLPTLEVMFSHRIQVCSVDSVSEIEKIAKSKSESRCLGSPSVLIRLGVQSEGVEINLNDKFGASDDEAFDISEAAVRLGVPVIGLCFHVGSQSFLVNNYERAVERCLSFLNNSKVSLRSKMRVLDIGGGFPSFKVLARNGIDAASFYSTLASICERVRREGYEVWAEPGRALATEGVGIVSSVIGIHCRSGRNWLFLDEGKYGCYSGKYQDFQDFEFQLLGSRFDEHALDKVWTIAGPTCDSTDIVAENVRLPADIKIGDKLFSPNIGAYSYAFASQFNGFRVASHVVI